MEGQAQPLARLETSELTLTCAYRQGQAFLDLSDDRSFPFSLVQSLALKRASLFVRPRLVITLKTGETVVDLRLSRRRSVENAALAFLETCRGCLKSVKQK